jgi:NAD(P)-dependent dehydrogenase (short-subunit alcohol dehydrogenase family)
MGKLAGKRILVTGGAAGIGRCLVARFLDAGAEVVATDINESGLAELDHELGARGRLVTRRVDVCDEQAVRDAVHDLEATVGEIDVLVNNAGIGHTGELAETTLDVWRRLMAVNFWGPLHHVYALLPSMMRRKSGHIVNVSSGQAFFRLPTWGPYATTKLALGAFSEMLRFEVRKHGIAVTTVYPFMVDTGFYRGIEGETWSQRLSMKLVPYYSMRPDTVARIIVRAVEQRRGVEMVHPLNDLVKALRSVPGAGSALSTLSMLALGKSRQ